MTVTRSQIVAVLQVIAAVASTIRDLGSVPSGHLYAQLSSKISLATYQGIIDRLKGAGLVTESGHLLTWVGPAGKDTCND